MTLVQLTCAGCDGAFYVKPGRVGKARFCSPACYHKAQGPLQQKRVILNCPTCLKDFSVPASHEGRRKFCSRTCQSSSPEFKERMAAIGAAGKGRKLPPKPRKLVEIACVVCGGAFRVQPAKAKHRVVCSVSCRGRLRSQASGVRKICEACGGEFKVPPVRSEKARFCSVECAAPAKAKELSGPRLTITCPVCGKTFDERLCHADRRVCCSRQCYATALSNRKVGKRKSVGRLPHGIIEHADGHLLEWSPDHPFARSGYVLQHRLVVERYLRAKEPDSKFLIKLGDQLYLSLEFEVHHKDEDKVNNAISNLECLTPEDHTALHARKRARRARAI